MSEQNLVDRVRAIGRLDRAPARRQPPLEHVLLATLVSIACSLLVDAVIVKIGISIFPATKNFSHFRFFDYGALTFLGVAAAGAAWPVVTRVTSTPRWFFFRLAVFVVVGLWLPDGWLILRGEPPDAVAVLMVMHLAIALATYNLLVRIAPVQEKAHAAARGPEEAPAGKAPGGNAVWIAMASGVALELVLGLVALLIVPTGRPSGWIPARGEIIYLAHAVLGAALAVGGLGLFARSLRSNRLARIGALAGLAGLGLGLGGGVLATYRGPRLAGMALMLLGVAVAGLGYLAPVVG